MKPQLIAAPLLIVLVVLLIGIAAGPLWVANNTMPFRLAVTNSVRNLAGFTTWFSDIKQLTRDRDRLATERNKLLAQVSQLQADQRENQALKKALGLYTNDKKDIIMAQTAGLVQQDNTSYLLINKGSRDKLQIGQIVQSEGILVGRVKQIADRTSLIQLPTSLGSAIPVNIRHGEQVTKGVVEGNYNLTAKLTQVLPTDELVEGDTIETSADGGLYPAGIVVGKVGQINNQPNQVFQTATVNLLWDIRKLEFVFISQS